MTAKNNRNAAELGALIAGAIAGTEAYGHNPHGHAGRIVEQLTPLARAAVRFAVNDCNRGLTPAEEKRDAANTAKIKALFEGTGIVAEVGGDPRGCVVYLHFPKVGPFKPANTWGGEESGWGVML